MLLNEARSGHCALAGENIATGSLDARNLPLTGSTIVFTPGMLLTRALSTERGALFPRPLRPFAEFPLTPPQLVKPPRPVLGGAGKVACDVIDLEPAVFGR
jgi:hypothetical protein